MRPAAAVAGTEVRDPAVVGAAVAAVWMATGWKLGQARERIEGKSVESGQGRTA